MSIKGVNSSLQRDQAGNITVSIAAQTSAKKGKDGGKTLFAGDTNLMPEDTLMTRFQARKRAMKVIADAYKSETNIDRGISDIKQMQKKKQEALDQASEEILALRAGRQRLREGYGVSEDSEEEQNLKALEALAKTRYGSGKLTEEEQERLNNMGPLTEYQKESLYYFSMEEVWQRRMEDARNGIFNASRTIEAIERERVKSHQMVDAQKEAADIMEKAAKQIAHMLMEDVKEQFDEDLNEKLEEAKQREKEQQEEEEKLEKARQEREEVQDKKQNKDGESAVSLQRAGSNDVSPMDTDILRQELQIDLMELAKKQNMHQEELKGILLDEFF